MKKKLGILILILYTTVVTAQNNLTDSVIKGSVVVNKDPRLDALAKKELEFNSMSLKSSKGYRLLVLSSNDRERVMSIRAKLLQLYPEQKVYMVFQNPFIKLKFGNFVEKPEAERYRDLLTSARLVPTNIYIVPEVVEVKSDKNKVKEEE